MYSMHQKKKYKDVDPAVILEKLPGAVTSIQIQARNSTRASVFVDDAFLFGATLDNLNKHSVQKGILLDKKTALSILELEEKHKLREYFLRLLTRRDHSKLELKQKAMNKGIALKFMDEVFEEFESLNYLNEDRFVKAFALEKGKFYGWGNLKIKMELKKKGISDAMIQQHVDETDTDLLKDQMLTLILKKATRFKRESDALKKKKKIYEHLVRKGYPSDVIMRYIEDYAKMI